METDGGFCSFYKSVHAVFIYIALVSRTLFLTNCMVEMSHGLDKDLSTLQHTLFTIAVDLCSHETTTDIIEIQILNGPPDIMHFIRRQRYLYPSANTKQLITKSKKPKKRQTILG